MNSDYWSMGFLIKQVQYRHIFCQNRLEAYDAITKNNLTPSDITIYDAINFVAQSWEHVTANTIIHSWGRARILPPTERFDDNLISMSEETEETNLKEIIDLIELLPINDPLDAQEYIEIDNYINIKEDLTMNNIVDLVNRQDECKSEEEQNEVVVKISDVIVGLDNLLKYIQQNNLEIASSLIKDLCNLKRYIVYLCNKNKRQATLEEFINLTD
ncbi:10458_t:CDS:2 [Cetraspora pellucida]|uniref:10458_t:CDS:1 n=1 Tax=Cetraspora pellucida TaxID=1433469 RepID=A0ACA9KAC0_9GLOM|nr:10458_t:CDS:2 [Cetraspora pellucida]